MSSSLATPMDCLLISIAFVVTSFRLFKFFGLVNFCSSSEVFSSAMTKLYRSTGVPEEWWSRFDLKEACVRSGICKNDNRKSISLFSCPISENAK